MIVIRMGWQGMFLRQAVPPDQLDPLLLEVNKLLSTSPIVMSEPAEKFANPHPRQALDLSEGQWKERHGLSFREPALFRAHWPMKNQNIGWHGVGPPIDYSGPAIEDFIIVYDGWAYCVAGKCEEPLPVPYSFDFGREAGQIIHHIFSRGDEIEVLENPIFGPTPMFPVIYLCVGDEPIENLFGRELISEFDTLESVYRLPSDDQNPEGSAIVHMRRMLTPVHAHYDDLDLRSRAMRGQMEFDTAFSRAAACFESLVAPAGFNFRERFRQLGLSREMRRLVGRCYMNYAAFQEQRSGLMRELRETDDLFAKDPLLHPHREYAEGHNERRPYR